MMSNYTFNTSEYYSWITLTAKKPVVVNDDNGIKIYSHYPTFQEVIDLLLGICGYKQMFVPHEDLVSKQFPSLWHTHRWGVKSGIYYEGTIYPKGFEIKFFYMDRRGKYHKPGAYDLDMRDSLKYLERLQIRKSLRTINLYLKSIGCEEHVVTHGMKGWELVDYKINHDPGRHWGKYEEYKNGEYFLKFNARDRDGKLIRNGEVKYYRDQFTGRLSRGKVYHNINNMWWILHNKHSCTNIASFRLFDATKDDFNHRRLKKDTAKPEDKVRRKIGTQKYYELKNLGIRMSLDEE